MGDRNSGRDYIRDPAPGTGARGIEAFAIRRPEIPVEGVGTIKHTRKLVFDFEHRQPIPGADGDLHQPIVFPSRQRQHLLHPIRRFPRPAQGTDVQIDDLLGLPDFAVQEPRNEICLLDAALREG